jgi:hypothetical protein
MHRLFQRKVRVVLLEQNQRLANDQLAILVGELPGARQERRQVHGLGEVPADRRAQLLQIR